MSGPKATHRRQGAAISVQRLAPGVDLRRPEIASAIRTAAGGRPIRSINVALVDEPTLTALHVRYFNDPAPTDVITFDLRDNPDDPQLEGEIVVSVDRARQEALAREIPARQELLRYIIHGALHLLGLDDHTLAGRRRMRRAEDRVLAELGEASPLQGGKKVRRRKPRDDA